MNRIIFILFIWCITITRSYSQAEFSITLGVQGSTGNTVYHNEPVIFSTRISNINYQEGLQWNQAADEWLAQLAADFQAGKITAEEYQKETELAINGKKTLTSYTIGSSASPWFKQVQFRIILNDSSLGNGWPIKLLGDVFTDSTAVLDEKGYYIVKHHLSARDVSAIRPGTYKITVFLAGVLSNTATLTIRRENIPGRILLTKTMQLYLGNYYLQRKNITRALVYADAILFKDPKDIDGLLLRGNIRLLQKKYNLALKNFEQALVSYYKKFPQTEEEPPVFLLNIIYALKNTANNP